MAEELDKFKETIKQIRDPKTGCIWNLEQSHASLKRYLLEELYETLDALDKVEAVERSQNFNQLKYLREGAKALELDDNAKNAYKDLQEELGDLLLQIVLHARLAEEKGLFDFEDVARTCNEKMLKRHPHVFKSEQVGGAASTAEVDKHWDREKAKEKKSRESIFAGIPRELPALARAWLISKKAVKESFEWDEEYKLFDQLDSEVEELKEIVDRARAQANDPYREGFKNVQDQTEAELEIGDILFTAVNIARWYRIDPEDALRKTNDKFERRFNEMMKIAAGEGKRLQDYTIAELESLWQSAKKSLSP